MTGTTLALFSTLIYNLIFFKISNNISTEIILKLCLSISFASKLFNYLMIKFKSTELFELSRRLKNFQIESRISQLPNNLVSILSIILCVLVALISTLSYFYVYIPYNLLQDLNERVECLPIPSFFQIFLMTLYHYSLSFVFPLLYIDYKTRYISIIKEFKKNVLNEKSEPDSDVLKLTQKYILKFVNFKNDIKRSVDFLKYGISLDFFSTFIVIINNHYLGSKSGCFHFGIAHIVLLLAYYLWTMSFNFRIRIIDNNLSFILNQWLHLNPEDSIQIEMDYIEKTGNRSNEDESSDDSF
jgi:hypothetical protein